METLGQKLDTDLSSKEDYEGLVRDGLLSIQYWLKHFEECNSTKELDEWQNIMNALVATLCSHKKKSKLITSKLSFRYQDGIVGTNLSDVCFVRKTV